MIQENGSEVVPLLEELVRWARFQGVQRAKDVLQNLLSEDTQRAIYHLSNGRSSEDISKAVGVSSQTVRNYWRAWFTSGIVALSKNYRGRFEKVFNLEDLAIPLPRSGRSMEKQPSGTPIGDQEVKQVGE